MVSVILPSYNSEKTIAPVLRALQNQTFSEPYEIILVDSSEDRTPEIVREQFPEIIYIHLPQKTDPGTARNLGVQKSSGDPILFIDSDCVAEPNWMETFVRLHRETDYAAVGGSVLNGNDPENEIAWAGYMAEFREFLPEHPQREVAHIPTCNISYKRRYLEELGGFNPAYYPQEDLDFNFRLRQAGGKILFYPGASVRHNHRTDWPSFKRHQHNVGVITSSMLHILPLEGADIARSKIKTLLAAPLLPVVKWWRTIRLFKTVQPQTLKKHPRAAMILALGLVPWTTGFVRGAFHPRTRKT
ncbi:MAG: glycosyltransferase [Calditrichaeota bacterium]|nr:MAG: glycosyltransferase [Calditrichota bacterium]